MILRRVIITLEGPDEYPADEGSYAQWEQLELSAIERFDEEINECTLSVGAKIPLDFQVVVE